MLEKFLFGKPSHATSRKVSPPSKKTTYKRFLVLLLSITLLVAAIYVWNEFSDPRSFPIRSVQVRGDYPHISKEDLHQAILPFVNTGFFSVSVEKLQKSLLEFPWVAEATVRRVWPDVIVVTLKEKRAIAQWGGDGLMNSDGQVFYPSQHTFPRDLPKLAGPDDTEKLVLDAYQKMEQKLEPIGLSIDEVILSKRHSWHLKLSNGMQIVLGQHDIMPRLQRFVDTYGTVFGSRGSEAQRVDLRYTNGIAVRWKQQAS